MKCSNCKQNEATMKFLQIINGEKTELFLCESCAEEMGIENIDITIPMDFSSFISEFFDNFGEQELLSALTETKVEKCENCGLSYDEFVKTGKLGCVNCYDVFRDRIELITKNIQGSSEHRGRHLLNYNNVDSCNKIDSHNNVNNYNDAEDLNVLDNVDNKDVSNLDVKDKIDENEKIEILKMKLKSAIRDERYEEAAKIRDEIKEFQNRN